MTPEGARPTILWLRRDLRLRDHEALAAAIARGGPVIPVFIRDDLVDGLAAAPKWRLGLALESFGRTLADAGSRLVLRSGNAADALCALAAETGAGAVTWSRLYHPDADDRDAEVARRLEREGVAASAHPGHVVFEPWTVQTRTGGFYRVYTPMWNAVKDREVAAPLAAPGRMPTPDSWPAGDSLDRWEMGRAMNRGAAVCLAHQTVGEAAAQERLRRFFADRVRGYADGRDDLAADACSGLSENLTYGEVSPRECWHAGAWALDAGADGAEKWLKELVWREFAYHLVHHTPEILTRSWRPEWEAFPWDERETAQVHAWRTGRTGIEVVDAAMREMHVTGRMHNRSRMIVASYLTKHMLVHWRIGQRWFEACLTDWDPASNAMGWQWVAGCGPDAAPYFRVFNPDTQAEKFDPLGAYRRRWIAEGQACPPETALSYFESIPRIWGLSPNDAYPAEPVVGLREGRQRALDAYRDRGF